MTIDSVFLQLYFNRGSGFFKSKPFGHSGNLDLIVEQIIEPWDEDLVCWKNYPKLADEKLLFDIGFFKERDFRLNVTELFLSNLQEESINLLVRLKNEQLGNYIHITSKEYLGHLKKPQLKIYAKNK